MERTLLFHRNPNKIQKILKLLPAVVLMCVCAIAAEISENVQLLGSISSPKGGVALIKNKLSGAIKAFRVGDDLYDFGRIVTVERTLLVLKTPDGQTVTISSKFGGGTVASARTAPSLSPTVNLASDTFKEDGFSRVGTKIEVDSRYKDKMINENLSSILMSATAEPVLENGQIKGFVLYQFDANSIFNKMGLKEGDTVTEINGVPLNNVAKTIQFLNGLRDEPNVRFQVLRGGQPLTMEMNVK